MGEAENLKRLVDEHAKLNKEIDERITKAEQDVHQARQEAKEAPSRQQ